MSYVCTYSSVQLDKRRVEKEFTDKHSYTSLGLANVFVECFN